MEEIKIEEENENKIDEINKNDLIPEFQDNTNIDFLICKKVTQNIEYGSNILQKFDEEHIDPNYYQNKSQTVVFKKLNNKNYLHGFSEDFKEENEIEKENIIFNDNMCIQMISMDLLFKKIALCDLGDFDFDVIEYLSMQINCLLDNDSLINKIESLFDYYLIDSSEKRFPFGMIKLLNFWIKNLYVDKISMQYYFKLKEIYDNITILIDNPYLANNPKIIEMELVRKFIEDKILYSPGNSDKLNKPISIYKNKQRFFSSMHCKNKPILPIRHSLYFDILEWSEVEIARQLSLISHFIIDHIHISEFYFARWTSGEKFTNSPHIMQCIDRFNKLSLWIIEEILSYDKSSLRSKVIEKFILVAHECYLIYNFNDCFNIITALVNPLIKCLRKSWNKIFKPEVIKIFTSLQIVCNVSKNFSSFREEMKKIEDKPCVPYLGMYLNSFAFLEEGPKYIKDKLINMEKIKKFGKIYTEFSRNKKYKYEFKPVFMLSFLTELHPISEDSLIELAKKIEPKFKLFHSKHNKKRLTSTDKKSFEMSKLFSKISIESINQNATQFDTISNKINLKDAIKKFIENK